MECLNEGIWLLHVIRYSNLFRYVFFKIIWSVLNVCISYLDRIANRAIDRVQRRLFHYITHSTFA